MKKYLSHYRALVSLGMPLIVGQIGVVLQNFADTLMIGHHTTVELAAASLVSNIFILGLLMAMGFALCMTPLIGKAYGQGDISSIGKTVKDALFSDPSVNDQFGCQSVHIPPLLSDNMVHYTFLEIALQ